MAATSDDRCLRGVYSGAVGRGQVAETLAALDELASRRRLDDCHLQAHRLAHAVYRAVDDVERTFLLGGPQCRMGYLHGAVEASGAAASAPLPIPRCSRFRIELQRLACAHGFGHAVMLRTHHDLRASVARCRSTEGIDGDACVLGAMMENSLRFAGRSAFTALAARGCRAIGASPELALLCFDNIGVVAALSAGHDAARAAPMCRRLPTRSARAACLAGMRGEIAEARRGGAA